MHTMFDLKWMITPQYSTLLYLFFLLRIEKKKDAVILLLQYVDLDEFLSENGIPVDGVAGGGQGTMQSGQLHKMNNTETPGHQGPAGLHLEPVTKRERSPSPSECCSPDTMNPPSPADSSEWIVHPISYLICLDVDPEGIVFLAPSFRLLIHRSCKN